MPDPRLRVAADQFESARALLWSQPPESGLLYPLMNTAKVAIELYLNCLSAEKVYTDACGGLTNISAKPSIRGHLLTTLLDNIDSITRQELDRTFADEFSGCGSFSFRDALRRCEGTFQESRYPFKSSSDASKYPLGILMACSHFLHQFVAKLQTKDEIRC
jgi:hypothetical protein